MPSDVVGWKPFVQSWLKAFLARQHAAAKQPPTAPAAEPSRLPEHQQSVMAVDGCSSEVVLKSTAGTQAGANTHSMHGTDSCSGSDGNSANLEFPEELQAVHDFLWGLFDKFVEPLLQWVAAHGSTLLPLTAVAQLSAVTVLFETQAEALRCVSTMNCCGAVSR
jgi:hypothetical protein